MTIEDRDSDPRPGPPHQRRGEERPPQIIEGEAMEIPDREAAEAPAPGDAEPRTTTAEAEPAAGPVSSGRLLPLIALALAFCALLGDGALWLQRRNASDVRKAQAQIAALDSQITALQRQALAAQDLERRVVALESGVKAAGAAAQAAQAQAGEAAGAAAAARQAADAARSAPAPKPAVAALVSSADAAALSALAQRVAGLEQRPNAATVQTTLSGQIGALNAKTAQLDSSLAALQHRIADLDATQKGQAARLDPLEGLLRAPKIDVPALEANNARAVGDAQAAALVVVAQSLQRAIDSGSPFEREAAAAAKLGADPALLKSLQGLTGGVATTNALSQSFADLVGPILAGVDGDDRGGVLDRLASEAGRLVQIRTVGQTTGDNPADLVGRMQSALAAGNVAAALQARESLPGPAKTITEGWAKRARARVAAQEAARALLEDAMTRVGKART